MTRQALLKKWSVYILALLPVWLLDAYVLSRWPLLGVSPTLLPIAVVALSTLEGMSGGMGFGLGVGLLWAAAYSGQFGLRVLTLTAVGLITGALAQFVLSQGFMGCFVCSAAVLAILQALHVGFAMITGAAPPVVLMRVGAAQFAWSLCWTPLIYGVFALAYRRVGGDRLAE